MVEDLEIKVIMTNQSFVDAGGTEVYPDLEIAGTVVGKLDKEENSGHFWNVDRVNKQLDNCAEVLGATHIFNVEYLFRHHEHGGEQLYGAVGTAYKPKTRK